MYNLYRYFFSFFISFLFVLCLQAQTPVTITNKGVEITINGGVIYNCGKITNKDTTIGGILKTGLFFNDGEIHLKSDIENKSKSGFYDVPVTSLNNGRTIFEGTGTQRIIGDTSIKFYKLYVSKIVSTDTLLLNQSINVNDTLKMISGNVYLNSKNIDLSTTGFLSGETNSKRIFGSSGVIKFKKITISSPNYNENYGGLGLMIKNTGISLGTTSIQRGHAASTGTADGSISRYFNFSPTNTGTKATFRMPYFNPNELSGTTPGNYVIWTSTDNGVSWINRGRKDSSQFVIGDTIPISNMRITAAYNNCITPPAVDITPATVNKCVGDSALLDAGLFVGCTYYWTFNGASFAVTRTIKAKNSGKYVVMVKTPNGCVGKDSVIAVFNPSPTAKFTFTSKCELDSTQFNASTSLGANLKFSWDYGDGFVGTGVTPKHEYLSYGWKTVTLRALDSLGGCYDDTTRQVPVYALPSADFSFSHLNCKKESISFTNSSTVPTVFSLPSAMSYKWNFDDGSTQSTLTDATHTYTLSPLDSTTFKVRLITTTSFGCIDTLFKNVFINPLPLADFSITNNVCFGFNTSFTNSSNVASGVITSYNWNFGDGTLFTGTNPPAHLYNATGTYSIKLVTITDSLCADSITKTITVNAKPTVLFTANNTCSGIAVAFNNQSSISSGTIASYQWDLGDGSAIQTTQLPIKTYTNSGTYTIKLVVFSSSGCSDSVSIPITIFPKPIASFSTSNVCLNQQSIFTNSSTISDLTALSYAWDLGDGTSQATSNVNHIYQGVTNYSVTLVTTSINACKDTFSTVVSVNSLPTANFSTTNSCQGNLSSFTNTSTGSSSNLWDFGNGTNSILSNPSISYLSPGTYSVKLLASTGFGCKDSITKTLTIFPKPDAQFTSSSTGVCLGASLSFTNGSIITSGSIVNNSWDFGDGTSSFLQSPTKVYGGAGSYTVQLIVNSNKGCKDTTTTLVNINAKPVSNFTINQNCGSDSVVFINTTNPLVSSNYNWNFGDGTTSLLPSPTKAYALPGIYSVKLIATNAFGCRDSIVKTVTYPTTPNTQFSFSNSCTGQSVSFNNTSTIGAGSLNYSWDFGDGTSTITTAQPSHTYNNAGTYTVQLISTAQSGCKDTLKQSITIGLKPIANFTSPNIGVCSGAFVSFTNSTLNANSTTPYFWDFGDGTTSTLQNPNKQYSSSGVYTVTLTAGYGTQCSDVISKSITIKEAPVAAFTTNTICKGSASNFNNTSSITTGTLTFSWNFGNFSNSTAINPILTYVNSGVYSVQLIVNASNGCSDTLIQNTTVNSVPQINLGENITTCGVNYLLDAQNLGSTYLWNTSITTQTLLVNTNGNYKVTVTLPNGCSASDSVDITLNVPTKPRLGNDTITCGTILLDAGYPNSIYQWSTGDNSSTLNVTNSGTYSVTVTDQNNCVGKDTIEVTIGSKPIVNLGADTTLCERDNLSLSAQAGFNYLWSNSFTSQSITPLNSGLYWVDVIDPITLCTGRDSINIVFKPIPLKPFGNDSISCNNVVLNANNFGSTYLWNTGSNSQTINAASTGEYSVIITGTNNCSVGDTINVTVNSVSVNLGPNQIGCFNSILPLDAGTGTSYLWSSGATSQIIQPIGSGLYSVVVTDANGCSGTGTVLITVNPSPLKPFTNDTIVCSGLLLNALNPGSIYQWSGQTNATTQTVYANTSGQYIVDITGANSCVTKDTINVLVNTITNVNLGNDTSVCQYTPFALDAGSAASYSWSTGATTQTIQLILSANYWVTTTDLNGCSDTDSINVMFKSSPVVDLGVDTSACGFFVLNAQNTGLTYLWNNGSSLQTINVTNSGLYYVDVTGLNGCVSSDSVQLTINQNPDVNFPANLTGCSGDAVILDAGNPGSTYSWNTGATTQNISVYTTGFYQVSITDGNNCSSTENGIVTFNNKPNFNLGPDGVFCGSALLNAGNPGCTYLWNTNSTSQTITATNSGTYSVKVTNQNLCFINDTINILVNPQPIVNLGNDTSICQGISLQLNAANPGSTFNWNTGANTQTITANTSGNYIVQVTNTQNCSKKDTIVVTVVNKPVVELGADKTLCVGSSVVLNAGNPGATFNWGSSNNVFSANTQKVNIQEVGMYWVNVTNGIGCSSSDSIQILLDDNYVVAKFLSASSAYTGDTLLFINLSYPNPQSYLWNFSDGIVTTQESPTHIFYTSSISPVQLVATKQNCSDTIVKLINIQQRIATPKDSVIRFIAPEIINAIAYPNPTSGNFTLNVTLNVTSELSIRILDIEGRMIAYRTVNANVYQDDFDLNKLTTSNGIYFVQLIAGQNRKTIKIIKLQ